MGSEAQPNVSPVVSPSRARVSLGGRTIQDEMTFMIQDGEHIAVLGPNGAGKRTLLKLPLGLIRPASGRVEVLGELPGKRSDHIGYVPQFRMIESDLTIRGREVVRFP